MVSLFCNRNVHTCAFLLQNGALWDLWLVNRGTCEAGLLLPLRVVLIGRWSLMRGKITMICKDWIHFNCNLCFAVSLRTQFNHAGTDVLVYCWTFHVAGSVFTRGQFKTSGIVVAYVSVCVLCVCVCVSVSLYQSQTCLLNLAVPARIIKFNPVVKTPCLKIKSILFWVVIDLDLQLQGQI